MGVRACDRAHLYKFSFLMSHKFLHGIWFQRTQQFFEEKKDVTYGNRVTFAEGQRKTLTFDTHVRSLDH